MIGSRAGCRSRLGKALLSADKCYHALCGFICVWLDGVDGGGGGGVTQIKPLI